MPEEIQPCPFCWATDGTGKADAKVEAEIDGFVRVRCTVCSATGPVIVDEETTAEDRAERAIESWNLAVRLPSPASDADSRPVDIGARVAKRIFDKRSAGKGQRNVEVHISEADLAAACALAASIGDRGSR